MKGKSLVLEKGDRVDSLVLCRNGASHQLFRIPRNFNRKLHRRGKPNPIPHSQPAPIPPTPRFHSRGPLSPALPSRRQDPWLRRLPPRPVVGWHCWEGIYATGVNLCGQSFGFGYFCLCFKFQLGFLCKLHYKLAVSRVEVRDSHHVAISVLLDGKTNGNFFLDLEIDR